MRIAQACDALTMRTIYAPKGEKRARLELLRKARLLDLALDVRAEKMRRPCA